MSTVGRGKSIHAPTKRTVFSWQTSRACLISHNNVDVISTWNIYTNRKGREKKKKNTTTHLIYSARCDLSASIPFNLWWCVRFFRRYIPFSLQFSWWQRVRLCKCLWLWKHVLAATMCSWQSMLESNSYQFAEVRNSIAPTAAATVNVDKKSLHYIFLLDGRRSTRKHSPQNLTFADPFCCRIGDQPRAGFRQDERATTYCSVRCSISIACE